MPAGLGQQAPSLKFMAMQALKELQALPGREVVLQCAAAHGGFCQGPKKKYYLLKIHGNGNPTKCRAKSPVNSLRVVFPFVNAPLPATWSCFLRVQQRPLAAAQHYAFLAFCRDFC
jgi:hypothetical protein